MSRSGLLNATGCRIVLKLKACLASPAWCVYARPARFLSHIHMQLTASYHSVQQVSQLLYDTRPLFSFLQSYSCASIQIVCSVCVSNTDMYTMSLSSFISNTDKAWRKAEQTLVLHHDMKWFSRNASEGDYRKPRNNNISRGRLMWRLLKAGRRDRLIALLRKTWLRCNKIAQLVQQRTGNSHMYTIFVHKVPRVI
jgi:hypothetical protein